MSHDAVAAPLRCSANVSVLFPRQPWLQALDAAAAAGFHTVELLDPYVMGPADLASVLAHRGLRIDLFNLPMGDFAAGERGYAGDPARRALFRDDLERALRVAESTGARKVNVLAGVRMAGRSEREQLECLVENLDLAARRLGGAGLRVVSELLNPVEVPGFLLGSVERVHAVLEPLDQRVGFQLDIYHLQRTQGELIRTIEALAPLTTHVQIADAPERSEPGSGEINLRNVLAAIVRSGYQDVVGLEYQPSAGCRDPFGWVEEYGLERA